MTIIVTIQNSRPESKIELKPRGNGIEWEKYTNETTNQKVYIPIIDGRDIGVVYNGNTSYVTILVEPLTNKPVALSEHDAQRVYDYIGQQIEQWSPNALARGNAHPNLMAAQQRHAEMAGTATLVTGGGGSSSRKTRKARK
jgi:hypothetical protein